MVATRPTKALGSPRAMANMVEESPVASLEEKLDSVGKVLENAIGTPLCHLCDRRWTSQRASLTAPHRLHQRGRSTPSSRPHTSSEDEDFKWARTAARPSVYAPEHQDGAQVSGERRHGTAFNFAVFRAGQQLEELASCFNVCGEQRRGLLVDPGAASGLIGSDTLKQLMDNCITPSGKQHEVSMNYDKTTPVSGISGEANQTLGEISLPLQAGGYSIADTADVIGGSGSTCPALVGNPTLRRLDASISANVLVCESRWTDDGWRKRERQ